MKNITVTFAAQTVRVLQPGPVIIFKCVLIVPPAQQEAQR